MNNSGRILRRGLMLAAATASVIALAACAGGGGGDAGGGGAEGEGGGKTDIRVQVAPIQYEAAYIAEREGYFEQVGLNVEIVPGADAAANLAQAASGDVDITTVSWGTAITSVASGMPISVISGNGLVAPDVDNSGIVVPADSPIQTVLDLQNANVAVVGVKSGGDVPMFQAVQAAGGDWTTINEVGMPQSGMQTALEQGTVDAAFPSDSYYHQMVDAGFRVIANPVREFQLDQPVTTWAATNEWLAQNPDTATKFNEAMAMAVDFYNDPANAEVLAEIVSEVRQIPIEEARNVSHVPFQLEINAEAAQGMNDAYAEFGISQRETTVDEILWENAPTA